MPVRYRTRPGAPAPVVPVRHPVLHERSVVHERVVRLLCRCPAARRSRVFRVRAVPGRCPAVPGQAARLRCPALRRWPVARVPQAPGRRHTRPVVLVRTGQRRHLRPMSPGSVLRYRTVPPRLVRRGPSEADSFQRWPPRRARVSALPIRGHRVPARRPATAPVRTVLVAVPPVRRARSPVPPVRRVLRPARSRVPPVRRVLPLARSPVPRARPYLRTTRVGRRDRRVADAPDHPPTPAPGPPVRVGSSRRRRLPVPPCRAYDPVWGRRRPAGGRPRRCVHPTGRRRRVSPRSRRPVGSTARVWPG